MERQSYNHAFKVLDLTDRSCLHSVQHYLNFFLFFILPMMCVCVCVHVCEAMCVFSHDFRL